MNIECQRRTRNVCTLLLLLAPFELLENLYFYTLNVILNIQLLFVDIIVCFVSNMFNKWPITDTCLLSLLLQHGVEKHLLRYSFRDQHLIPDEILWRRKEAFSDGVMSVKKSWYVCLQEHLEDMVRERYLAGRVNSLLFYLFVTVPCTNNQIRKQRNFMAFFIPIF